MCLAGGATSASSSLATLASLADVVLNVSYTFAWDYPAGSSTFEMLSGAKPLLVAFTLKHQNTSVVLLSGKGTGPFSGPAGAPSVAGELVKTLKPFRIAAASSTG
jgi:hypothetical protein